MTAQAAKTSGFAGWSSNGIAVGKSARLAFVMASNLTFTATIASAKSYAPTSVAGKTLSSSGGDSDTFGAGGIFTLTQSGQTKTESYTYAQFSPLGGMGVISPSDGSTIDLQLTFTSASAGPFYMTAFDANGALEGVKVSPFTLK